MSPEPTGGSRAAGGAAARLKAWLDVPIAAGPAVAADSDTVLFLSNEAGHPQPYAVARTGGPARRLWDLPDRTGTLLPSPKDDGVLLFRDRGGDERWQIELGAVGGHDRSLIALRPDPNIMHLPGRWDPDGRSVYYSSNERDPRFFDVHAFDPRHPEGDRVLIEEDAVLLVLDARDGSVLVGRQRTNLDVELLLWRDGRAQVLNPHTDEEIVLSAGLGADAVYAAATPGREFAALVRYRPGRSGPEFVRELPGDVELLRVHPRGDGLLYTVNRDGWSEAHYLDLGTGEDRPLTSGPRGVIGNAAWCPDGVGYVFELSPSDGVEVFYRALETGKERRLTRSAVPLPERPVTPRLAGLRTSDGVRVPYWDYARPDRAARGTVVVVHGGPESQARPGFAPVFQFLVGEGWRVVAPNVRGSFGYGRTFLHLDDIRRRMDSVRDLKELVEHLRTAERARSGPIAVAGGSYGGFMVLSALTTYPDLFAAGIDIVGIANFLTFLERTSAWRRPLREAEYGSLERDREFLREISPLFHAERIRAPLLVVHGRNDPRVPFGEAEQIVATLRGLGRPVELLEFADEGHGLHRRAHQVETWTRAVEFLDRYLPAPP